MDTDRNLLFGVLALQADLIDPDQFVRACTLWSAQKSTPLADLLVKLGWLTPADRADVEKLLDRKLRKHQGDARASLAEVTTDPLRRSLAGLADDDVRQSLADTPAQPGHVLLGTTAYVPETRERYTLSRLHATGGIGRVWLARDANLARDVALKELRPERADNPAVWARFLKEAQITGQLEHPGIVPIYEVSKRPDDQAPFYTMRFVRGRTLSQAVLTYHQKRAHGEATPLELRELLGAFVGVCNAVAYAHSRGVMHRDLKPQNVVLGDYGEVIVLDWGLARLIDQPDGDDAALLAVSADTDAQGTIQGQVLGTPAYMAPEQAEGRLDRLGPATDVYGLGAILYEILAGKPPFSGPETTALLRRVIHEPPARPLTLVAGTPPALEAVCLKALAKKPAERYGSASQLANEIRHYLADEPVSAYPDPVLSRLGRKARRHRTLVAGLAAAALVAVVSLTAATVLLTAANRRESEARILAQQRGEEAERESARALANFQLAQQRGKEAERESDKARANFQLARDAVEEYCSKVSDDPRLKQKDLEVLRKDLLQSAVKFHQKFVEQHGDDPALRADLGRAYLDQGTLVGNIGDMNRAIALLQQAAAVYEQLASEKPQERSYPVQLAKALLQLGGQLGTLAQTKDAQAAYVRGLNVLDAEHQKNRSSPETRSTYVRICSNLGHFLIYKVGTRAEGINYYRKAVALQEANPETATATPTDVARRAQVYATLGEALITTGEVKEGRKWCAKALQTIKLLTPKEHPSPEILTQLSYCYDRIGRAHSHLGEWRKAAEAFQKTVEYYSQLVIAHPGVGDYQEGLSISWNLLYSAQMKSGKQREAIASLSRSVQLKEALVIRYPDVPDYKANLVRGLANLSQYISSTVQARASLRRAETLAKELNARYPRVAQYQQALVMCYQCRALFHKRTKEIPEALQALDQALGVLEGPDQLPAITEDRGTRIQCYLEKFDLYWDTGKDELAAGALRKALALKPKDPQVLYRCANSLMSKGWLDEAREALTQAVALKPDFAEAQCNLGQCLVRQGRFVEGLAALQRGHELGSKQFIWLYSSASWVRNAQKLVQLDGRLTAIRKGTAKPADAREQLDLADLCRQYKKLYAASVRFYADAFAADPKLAGDLKARSRYDAALAAALAVAGKGTDKLDDKERVRWRKQALEWLTADLVLRQKQADSNKASDRNAAQQAMLHWQKEPDLAALRDKESVGKLPEEERRGWQKLWGDVDALVRAHESVRLGLSLKAKGDLVGAITAYRQAISGSPRSVQAHLNLGLALDEQGLLDDAIHSFETVVALDATNTWGHNNLGWALRRKGKINDAIACYRKAVACDPSNVTAHRNLGFALRDQGKLDDAVAAFRQAIKLDPDFAASHDQLGWTLRLQGKLDEAILSCRKAIELQPREANSHNSLGVVLRDQGKLDDAVAAFREANMLDPKYTPAYTNLAIALRMQGKLKEALAASRQAVSLTPTDTWANDNLATTERLVAVQDKLPAVLKGTYTPRTSDELHGLKDLCLIQKQYLAAARMYAAAFAADAKLAGDLKSWNRYNAACCAALAVAGKLEDKERVRWRKQALEWLNADLTHWTKQAEKATPADRPAIREQLRHWQTDSDLAGVRDEKALARLPAAEQTAWRKLWADVALTVGKVGEK